jgi:hypothetical protein
MHKRTTTRRLCALITLLWAVSAVTIAHAKQSPGVRQEAAWYEGILVTRLAKLNDPSPLESKAAVPDDVPNPIYSLFSPGRVSQPDPVIGFVPGDAGYTAWWRQVLLIDASGFYGVGRDVAQNPYTSVAEIEANLCPVAGDFSVFHTCVVVLGKPLVDITAQFLPPDFGLLNAQIINTPPAMGVCTRN